MYMILAVGLLCVSLHAFTGPPSPSPSCAPGSACAARAAAAAAATAEARLVAIDKAMARTAELLRLHRRKQDILSQLRSLVTANAATTTAAAAADSQAETEKISRELFAIESEVASLVAPTAALSEATALSGFSPRVPRSTDLTLHRYLEKTSQHEVPYAVADAKFTVFKLRMLYRPHQPTQPRGRQPPRGPTAAATSHAGAATPAMIRAVGLLDFHGQLHFLVRKADLKVKHWPLGSIDPGHP